MKPTDVLPDDLNAVEKEGVTIRKGTLGAFSGNIKIIESCTDNDPTVQEAKADLLELIPALIKLNFFDFYTIKSDRVRKIIHDKYPEILLD